MTLHKEIHLENDICAHLAANGWLYAEGDFAAYDRARALFPADLTAWIQQTQSKAWEAIAKNHGASAESVLLDRVRKQLDERGTLDVLRHGIDLIGLRQPLSLAQFKPALAMNPDLQARYAANRLRVLTSGWWAVGFDHQPRSLGQLHRRVELWSAIHARSQVSAIHQQEEGICQGFRLARAGFGRQLLKMRPDALLMLERYLVTGMFQLRKFGCRIGEWAAIAIGGKHVSL